MSHVLSKSNEAFVRLIDAVADADKLTLVVGAGASMDAGLPSWKNLVRTFLEEGFHDAEKARQIDDTRGYAERAESILNAQDVFSAATIGRFLHGEKRDGEIKAALYREHSSSPRPGRITTAIAGLAWVRRQRLRILTTNYDDLIEKSIEAAGRPVTVKTVSEDGIVTVVDGGDDATEIVHLHGYAPYGADKRVEGLLILDEEDYATTAVRPPGDILPDLLDPETTTVFVGLSMTDPNLVVACHLVAKDLDDKARRNLPWFGLFVGDAIPDDTAYFLRMRLERMGVRPISLVSFGQISQIFYEAIRRIAQEEEYWSDELRSRYGQRFLQWRRDLEAAHPCATGGDGYRKAQKELHNALADLVRELRRGVLSAVDQDEHLAATLWVRKPGDRLGTIQMWGSSAVRYRDPWPLQQELDVKAGTGFQVVDSVYYAAIQRRNTSPEGVQTRWQAMISLPVDLSKYEYAELVVGVITIASTRIATRSILRDANPDMIDKLHAFGQEWLTPSPSR